MKVVSLLISLFLAIPLFAAGAPEEESKVVLHLLDHTGKAKAKGRFWIDWNKSWRGIVQSRKVTGKEADAIIALLKKSLQPDEATNFCGHDPIYGIVATEENGKQLETSLCFKCVTWVRPGKRLVISGKPGADNPLAVELRKVIEIPQELRKKNPETPHP